MSVSDKLANWFQKFLPSPFSIAIFLSLITFIAAFALSDQSIGQLVIEWEQGLWDPALLSFAFQMMMMLVLGHIIALTAFVNKLIRKIIAPLNSTASAAMLVGLSTIIVGYINWGLALVFGAILARKVGEHFSEQKRELNYPLIGAAGYVGLMVWHGGLSGSALLKVAEAGHLRYLTNNNSMPEVLSFSKTVFSPLNITAFILISTIIPMFLYYLGTRHKGNQVPLPKNQVDDITVDQSGGMEKMEQKPFINHILGIGILVVAIYIALSDKGPFLSFINPNFINFCLLGLGIGLHSNIKQFLWALDQAIRGASGILIQFPLYFGILALMKSGGLIELSSSFFIQVSNEVTLPLFTFISAGLVNIFVPSGGGQWAIQGPIIVEAAQAVGVPLYKSILALAYGDQLTNMLQPFWALPLLSITGLKAKEIVPYTIQIMLVGGLIFGLLLLLF